MSSSEKSESVASAPSDVEKEFRELERFRSRHAGRAAWLGIGAVLLGLYGFDFHQNSQGWLALLLYAASAAGFGLATADYARSVGQSPRWGRWSLLGTVIVAGLEDVVGERLDRLRTQVPEKQPSQLERTIRLVAAFSLPCSAIVYYLGDWQLPNDDLAAVLLCLTFAACAGVYQGIHCLAIRYRAGLSIMWAIIAVIWSGGWVLKVGSDFFEVKENPPTTVTQRTIATSDFSGLLPPGWRTKSDKISEPNRLEAEHERFGLSLSATAVTKAAFGNRTLEELAEERLDQEKAQVSNATWYGKRFEQAGETRRLAYTFHYVTGSRDEKSRQYHFWRLAERVFIVIGEGPTKNVMEHQDDLKNAMDSVRSR